MEILVFVFVISQLNLVLADENVAIDQTAPRQATYKVHPDPEDVAPPSDQMAESSQSIGQAFVRGMTSGGQKQIQEESQNHMQVASAGQVVSESQNLHRITQQQVRLQEALRHNNAQNIEVMQPGLNQVYQNQPQQQVYVHQYPIAPIRILDVEAAPLHQTPENQNTLGYSSYVEHISPKEEEEINSALKEGSVSDIKRLVPKSGISFKIYKSEKNLNAGPEKPEIQPNLVAQIQQNIPPEYSHNSKLHHKIKSELPATQVQIQPAYQEHKQPTSGLEQLQPTYLKVGEQQHGYEHPQQLLQSTGEVHDQQSVNGQTVYYTQPEVNSQKAFLEVAGKTSSFNRPHFNINTDNTYSKATSTAEFNSLNTIKGSKHIASDFNKAHYYKQWNSDSKTEGTQRATQSLKPPAALIYELDPVAQAEKVRGVQYPQTQAVNTNAHIGQSAFNSQKTSVGEKNIKGGVNYLASSYIAKGAQNNFPGHLAKGHGDQNAPHLRNRFSGNYVNPESIKSGQNVVIHHLGGSAYGGLQTNAGHQQDHLATKLHPNSETAKTVNPVTTKTDLISHLTQNPYAEAKGSQNNFDHQKALEGSTSFDIKNAIDNTGSLIHQTSYVSPASEAHPVEELQKHQFAYIIPTIPTSTVLLDNSIHESPVAESHQVKDFGVSSPQLSYQTATSPEVSGKFFNQPQTIVWTSEHLKQGNPLTANNLHHSFLKLHLPKEEFYQHVKTPNVEQPTSTVSHVAYQHQKQPYVIHYEGPFLKHPQEIHYQTKTKTRIQNHPPTHIKIGQPLAIDWSLFKSPVENLHSLTIKPELVSHIQEQNPHKKIIPILVRKRKNRSNGKQEVGVVYGKVNSNRRPTIPNHRQEKNVRINLMPESSNTVKSYEPKGNTQNEFSVSASYKVDRSFESPNSS